MKILIKEKLSEHKVKTPEGYLICMDSILARTGKQTYMKKEVYPEDFPDDDSEIDIDREEQEVFSKETMASFENKPITIDHPDENVTPENYRDLAVGFVRDIRKSTVDGQDVMIGNLVITNQEAIDLIENDDMHDLSCGYDCDVTMDDNPRQVNIRGNHIALCECGRAGIAHIIDSVPVKETTGPYGIGKVYEAQEDIKDPYGVSAQRNLNTKKTDTNVKKGQYFTGVKDKNGDIWLYMGYAPKKNGYANREEYVVYKNARTDEEIVMYDTYDYDLYSGFTTIDEIFAKRNYFTMKEWLERIKNSKGKTYTPVNKEVEDTNTIKDYAPEFAMWVMEDGVWKIWGGRESTEIDKEQFLKEHPKYSDVVIVKNGTSPDEKQEEIHDDASLNVNTIKDLEALLNKNGIKFRGINMDDANRNIIIDFSGKIDTNNIGKILTEANYTYEMTLNSEYPWPFITVMSHNNEQETNDSLENKEDVEYMGYVIKYDKDENEWFIVMDDDTKVYFGNELSVAEDAIKGFPKRKIKDSAEFNKAFYKKAIKELQDKLHSLERKDSVDTNKEEYADSKANMKETIIAQINDYKEKLLEASD